MRILGLAVPGAGASIVLAAVGLTATLGAAVFAIQTRYLDRQPYFFDHVYYALYNIRLFEQATREGQLQVALREWLTNARHPLRTVPLLLLAPGLLTAQLGHLSTSLPFLTAFLALLGLYVRRRTGSLAYAVACLLLYCALPGLFDARLGLGAFWLETAATPLFGSALLCVLLSDRGRRLGWLAGFALFAALAILSRYITIGFLGVMCAPILAVWLLQRARVERDLVRTLLVPGLVIGSIMGALAGYFLVAHFVDNQVFYTFLGPIWQGRRKALEFTIRVLSGLTGWAWPAALLVAAATTLLVRLRRGPLPWESLVLSGWLAGALPTLLVWQGAAEAAHVVYAVVPPLFIACTTPVPLCRGSSVASSPGDAPMDEPARSRAATLPHWLAPALGAVAAVLLGWNMLSAWRGANDPPPNLARQKAFDIELASLLASQGEGLVWYTYFDEYAWIPTLEAYFRFDRLVLPAGQPFYHHHGPHWAVEFPGYSPEALGRRVADGTTRWVDVAVVFDDPSDADTNRWMTNPHSRMVARMVAEEVRAGGPWQHLATIESPEHGRLAVYRNRAMQGIGYEQALHNTLWP